MKAIGKKDLIMRFDSKKAVIETYISILLFN
jgi:hypothetical protein